MKEKNSTKAAARKELRADKEFACDVVEYCLPDDTVRKQCCEFLANSIHLANQLAPLRWGITLYADFVLLNCGMIEIMQILPDRIHVLVDNNSLPEILPNEVEVRKTRNGSTKGFYPSVVGSVACDFDADNSHEILPQLEKSHKRLIQNAAQTPFVYNRRNAHSPGVIDYLNEYLNLSLPQPAYFESTKNEDNDRANFELGIDSKFFAIEGEQQLITHLRRERDPKIVALKKQQVLQATGKLSCEVCAFDFKEKYGELGTNFCEAHHVAPLSDTTQQVETRLSDLAILCSNCHRMIHRTKPMESVAEFKQRLAKTTL